MPAYVVSFDLDMHTARQYCYSFGDAVICAFESLPQFYICRIRAAYEPAAYDKCTHMPRIWQRTKLITTAGYNLAWQNCHCTTGFSRHVACRTLRTGMSQILETSFRKHKGRRRENASNQQPTKLKAINTYKPDR